MRLEFTHAALRDLRGIPTKAAESIAGSLATIAEDAFGSHPQAKPLQGMRGWYRLRRGDWRAIYRIDARADVVMVQAIKHQREVYR